MNAKIYHDTVCGILENCLVGKKSKVYFDGEIIQGEIKFNASRDDIEKRIVALAILPNGDTLFFGESMKGAIMKMRKAKLTIYTLSGASFSGPSEQA